MNHSTRRSRIGTRLVLGILACSLFLGTPLVADENDNEASGWDYQLTLYLLAAAQSGSTTVRGIDQDLDVSFSDILSNLEAGGMLHFRAQSERWLAQVDTIFMRLKAVIGP